MFLLQRVLTFRLVINVLLLLLLLMIMIMMMMMMMMIMILMMFDVVTDSAGKVEVW